MTSDIPPQIPPLFVDAGLTIEQAFVIIRSGQESEFSDAKLRGRKIKRMTYKRAIYLDARCRRLMELRRKRKPKRRGSWARSRRAQLDHAARLGRWIAPAFVTVVREERRRHFLDAIARLRRIVYVERKPIALDFSRTQRLYASGTLLLVAELRRLIRLTRGEVSITCEIPSNNKTAQVLKQVGIFDLLGTKCDVKVVDDDVVTWRYAHGHRVDGEQYENVLGAYDGQITEALTKQLYKGITEAMTNVVNHAYIAPRLDELPHQTEPEWWMFSRELDGRLSVVFCDLGAGIPATLPAKKPTLWEMIQRLGAANDGDAIGYAIQDSISRTGASHRGKGLGQIVRALDSIKGSNVEVMSNGGGYRRRNGKTTLFRYRDSIMGTLISWQIPLHGEAA